MKKWNKIVITMMALQMSIVSVSLGQTPAQPQLATKVVEELDEKPAPAQLQSEDGAVNFPGISEHTESVHLAPNPWLQPQIIILLVMMAAFIAFGIWTAKRKPTSGIAGWLLLPAIGLVLNPILAVVYIAINVEALSKVSAEYIAAIHTAIAKNVILLGFGLYVAVLFFRKKQNAPQMYILFIWASLGFSVLVAIQGGEWFLKPVFMTVVQALIWIPYFKNSKRVKATFGLEDKTRLPIPPEL